MSHLIRPGVASVKCLCCSHGSPEVVPLASMDQGGLGLSIHWSLWL